MALIIKGDMPSICKKCKIQGGLTDGSFNYICCDDNYLDFYCEGDNPNGCQILCEIPDKHGDLVDVQAIEERAKEIQYERGITYKEALLLAFDEASVVVEATE